MCRPTLILNKRGGRGVIEGGSDQGVRLSQACNFTFKFNAHLKRTILSSLITMYRPTLILNKGGD